VVAKAIPITGQANTRKGSAGEVLMQIQQCFGEGFRDPVTLQEHEVHQVRVITNKTISTEARRSLESALRSGGRDRYVEFIDGEKLWKLVEQHMPNARALQSLSEAKLVFDELDTHYRPTVHMTGSDIVLGVEPKFPGAMEEKPFEMKVSVTIPDLPDNESIIRSMEQHITTGAPVEIPGSFVQMTLPEGFAQLFGPEVGALRIGPVQNKRPFLARLEFEADDGARQVLDYVYFMATQVGADEITLTNEEQPIPVHADLIVRPKANEVHLALRFAPLPMNVHQFAQIMQLQSLLGRSCTIQIVHLETGITAMQASHSGPMMEPIDPAVIEELNDLDAIQAKTKRTITFPARAITADESRIIAKLRTILHEGEFSGTWNGSVRMESSCDSVREWLQLNEREGVKLLRLPMEDSEELFGTTLPLGPVVITLRGVELVNMADVQATLAEPASDEATIELVFGPTTDSTCLYQYPDWGATVIEWRADTETEDAGES
jgi:hypothetical protein